MSKSSFQNSALVIVMLLVLIALSLGITFLSGEDLGSFGSGLISSLFVAMLLFLVASGLSIVFGLMDVLNLAQGAYFTLGAYVAWQVHHWSALDGIDPNIRFVLALITATIVGGILGMVLERGLLQPLYSRPIFQIVLTFGVGIVMGEIIKGIWGTAAYQWTDSFYLTQTTFTIFDQQFNLLRPFVIGVGFALIVLIALLLRYTRIGIIIRAGVEDSQMVEALGINVRFVFTAIFTLGCAIAAFGGAVSAPFLGASLGIGQGFFLGALAVVVLGGMGSYEGTAVGSILVGLAQQVVIQIQQYASSAHVGSANILGIDFAPFLNGLADTFSMTSWPSMTPMILLVLVLLLRPAGLFGKEK
jgi:branched-chain amino acid transport system permease protein